MNRKIIYLGYQLPLVKSEDILCSDDILFNDNEGRSKYHEFLCVLMDNKEYLKTAYSQYLFRNFSPKEVEEQINAKFPISYEKYLSLDDNYASSMKWSSLGIDNNYYIFKRAGYKELIKRNLKFYVPIPLLNNLLHTVDVDKVFLPKDLIEYVHKGKAKIVIYQDSEGFLYNDSDFEWFNKFAVNHNFNKDNFIVESANQNFLFLYKQYEEKTSSKNRFNIFLSTDFEDRPWFLRRGKNFPSELSEHYKIFFEYLEYKIQFKYKKKLSALARRCSPERAAIFHKVQTTPVLKDNTYSSLHNPYKDKKHFLLEQVKYLQQWNVEEVTRWLDKNFDFVNGFSCDLTDQHVNWASELNPDMHRNTLVNVTIETHQRPSEEIFLSEKTYRPIYTAQPFIIFGNPGTLRVLKEMGYKTFDKFWDESYDQDLPISHRLEKLFNTMIEIAQTPNEVLNGLMEDIEPILRHNFNVLMSSERILNKQKIMFNGLYSSKEFKTIKRKLI